MLICYDKGHGLVTAQKENHVLTREHSVSYDNIAETLIVACAYVCNIKLNY